MAKINMASIKENGEDAVELATLVQGVPMIDLMREMTERQEAQVNLLMDLLEQARKEEAALRARLGAEMRVQLGSVRFDRLKVQYRDLCNGGR